MSFNQIAFIGLGNMGSPMAQNLLKAGFKLKVYDLNQEAVSKLSQNGGAAAKSIADCVKDCDLVISMLPSSPHVKDVYKGHGNIFESAKSGTFFIDCSTISPQVSKEVADEAHKRGFQMVDAPVSGGTSGAQQGTLTFIVGGSDENFSKAKPILEKMGKNIFHAGKNGSGQVAKICNNMLLAIHMIGTSEALNLGVACGMDPKKLSEIMAKSSGRNWSLEVYNPYPGVMENVPSSRGYEGGFMVDLMAKDLGLAMEASQSLGTKTPLGEKSAELYKEHSKKGNGRLDFSSILNFLKK